jgi:hypothetical protein
MQPRQREYVKGSFIVHRFRVEYLLRRFRVAVYVVAFLRWLQEAALWRCRQWITRHVDLRRQLWTFPGELTRADITRSYNVLPWILQRAQDLQRSIERIDQRRPRSISLGPLGIYPDQGALPLHWNHDRVLPAAEAGYYPVFRSCVWPDVYYIDGGSEAEQMEALMHT